MRESRVNGPGDAPTSPAGTGRRWQRQPLGGTKIAWDAWGGSEVEPKKERSRQRFDLVTADPRQQGERLISLGAIHLSDLPDGAELADADGNYFGLHGACESRPSSRASIPVIDPAARVPRDDPLRKDGS